MKASVFPSRLSGNIRAPASKSHFIRVVASAILADGISIIYNPSWCDDAKAILNLAWDLDAEPTQKEDYLEISGNPSFKGGRIYNCGESGLAARLILGLSILFKEEAVVCGLGTLLHRKLGDVAKPLQQLGMKCVLNDNKLPARIQGRARPGKIVVDGSESSQFISGLLMALPLLNSDSELIVKDLKSRPYIDLTLETLADFGIVIQNADYRNFTVNGNQRYKPANIRVEGDWSGGAFLLVSAALNNDLKVEGLNIHSKQADRAILQVLESAGADVSYEDSLFSVITTELKAFDFDATHCPDLFPPIAVLAANCYGTSKIKGVSRLLHKESDRGTALFEELGKLNIKIELDGDEMLVTGGQISGGEICSRNDHRMAMAGAVAALTATAKVEICQAESVSKSWPGFFEDIQRIGGKVECID